MESIDIGWYSFSKYIIISLTNILFDISFKGRTVMKAFNILPKSYGFTYDYDPKLNPSILNSFATAAYRFHTLVQVNISSHTNTEYFQNS